MPKKGYKQSKEHIDKLKKSKTGKRNSSYGLYHSEKKICPVCSNVFYARYGGSRKQWGSRIFCSRKCRYESQKGKPSNIKGKKCPSNCGENNNMWKGGVTSLNKSIRQLPEFKEWKIQVFGRDNFTCQECGKRGVWLEAHHIKSVSNIITENNIFNKEEALMCNKLWDLNNGITYCKPCHELLGKKGGLL